MRVVSVVAVMGLGLVAAGPAWAQCAQMQMPSPTTERGTDLALYNDSSYPVSLYWADFDGLLQPYAVLAPGQEYRQRTYVGHQWYLDAETYTGYECLGPVMVYDESGCDLTIGEAGGGGIGLMPSGSCG